MIGLSSDIKTRADGSAFRLPEKIPARLEGALLAVPENRTGAGEVGPVKTVD